VVLAASAAWIATPGQAVTRTDRPNIVLISADDMNESDLRWMPETRRLLAASGVTVDDFISNHPLCCPARAEILTGQYGHNNGVLTNDGRRGGYDGLRNSGNNVGAWLKSAGYRTAFVGKHMNHWPDSGERQPGWTVFNPILKGVYRPFDLTMYNNGHPRRYTGTHTSDVVGGLTVRYIKKFSASGSAPFFIWSSQVAPHFMDYHGRFGPPVPAARHRRLYPNALPPSLTDPAFNEDDVSDKPGYVENSGKVSVQRMIDVHRARIRSLRSVDDQVAATVAALKATGELRNTYIFFTSDNGYLLGEHRRTSKNQPYEPALQVPLLVRGPGLAAGTERDATYSLVDLAPTFVDVANATAGRTMDGRSMMGTLLSSTPGYGHYLIQAGAAATADHDWWWRGVRSNQYVYIRYDTGFEELYDLANDAAELENVATDPGFAAVREEYATRLSRLETCSGTTCRTGGDAATTLVGGDRTVRENVRVARLRVTRGGDVAAPASVDYARAGGNAEGSDLVLRPGTLTFAAGESTKTIAVTIRNDARPEAAEAARISLSTSDASTATQATTSLRLTIGASDQQPDATISTGQSRAYVGNDVYNTTGARQTQTQTARRRETRTFRIRVYNDGNIRNTLSLRSGPDQRGSRVRYHSAGHDVTRAMRSRSGLRVRLRPGLSRPVLARVTILRSATVGSAKQATIRGVWVGDGTRTDVARAVVDVIR
jgi:N-acetylglucosamine-6-sulfatase